MAQGEAVLPINIVAFDPSIVGNDDEKAGIERIDPNSLSLFVTGNFVQERVTYFPQGLLHRSGRVKLSEHPSKSRAAMQVCNAEICGS